MFPINNFIVHCATVLTVT